MRRLTIFVAVLAAALILTETNAFAQRNYGGGGRIRETPGMRGRGGQGHERKTNYGRVRSGTRGSKGSVELNGRKSVNDRLSRNTKLSGRLQTLLPGQDLEIASSGFKNLGQFVAAVHVSKNLDIPFEDLKYQMTNPDSPKSLGKAIRQLRPDASSRREARKAKKQAKKDLKETSE
jgi:hypothetical protein